MKTKKTILKAFTLVELVIVIMILTVLAVLAVTSFMGYSEAGRDSNRLATVKNIKTGVDVFLAKTGKVPDPSDVFGSGVLDGEYLNTVGYVGDTLVQKILVNEVPHDPLTGERFMYGVDVLNRYYQVGYSLEKNLGYTESMFPTHASALGVKRASVNGNYQYPLFYKEKMFSLPSLLYIGENYLSNTGSCFIVDGGLNTPDSLSGSCIEDVAESLKHVTGHTGLVLTGVEMPNIPMSDFICLGDNNWVVNSVSRDLGVDDKNIIGTVVYGKYFTAQYLEKSKTCQTQTETFFGDGSETQSSETEEVLPSGGLCDGFDYQTGCSDSDIANFFASGSVYSSLLKDKCMNQTISVITLTGTSLPTTIPANTIYRVGSGTYTLSGKMSIGSCSGLVGDGDAIIQPTFTSTSIPLIGISKWGLISGIIIDGMNKVNDGIVGGGGYTDINILNRLVLKNFKSRAIYMESSRGLYGTNLQFYNNLVGLRVYEGGSISLVNSVFVGGLAPNDSGVSFGGRCTNQTYKSNGNFLNNVTFSGLSTGISLTCGENNTYKNIIAYSNTVGISIGGSDTWGNVVDHYRGYDNDTALIGNGYHDVYKYLMIYGNTKGIDVDEYVSVVHANIFANNTGIEIRGGGGVAFSNIFNNGVGVYGYGFGANNINVFNNSEDGVNIGYADLGNSVSNSRIFANKYGVTVGCTTRGNYTNTYVSGNVKDENIGSCTSNVSRMAKETASNLSQELSFDNTNKVYPTDESGTILAGWNISNRGLQGVGLDGNIKIGFGTGSMKQGEYFTARWARNSGTYDASKYVGQWE